MMYEVPPTAIVTLPNGVVFEAEMEVLPGSCILCEENAVRLVIPAYRTDPELVIEQMCENHLSVFLQGVDDNVQRCLDVPAQKMGALRTLVGTIKRWTGI